MYASADAVTTGPKQPPAGRQPARPTQYTHEQQPRHLIPRSGTHSQTRFGALMRARVGGGGGAKQPPCCAHGPSTCWICLLIPSWAPSKLIWVGGAVKRSHMLLLQHPKTPSRHWLSGVYMCMYVYVSVCMCKYWMYQYVWPVWTNKRYIYCHFLLLCNSTSVWVAHMVTYDHAGGSSNRRKVLFVISMPRTTYIQIHTYTSIYMHIHNHTYRYWNIWPTYWPHIPLYIWVLHVEVFCDWYIQHTCIYNNSYVYVCVHMCVYICVCMCIYVAVSGLYV